MTDSDKPESNKSEFNTPFGVFTSEWEYPENQKKLSVGFNFVMPKTLFGYNLEEMVKSATGKQYGEKIFNPTRVEANAVYFDDSEESIKSTSLGYDDGEIKFSAGEMADLSIGMANIDTRVKYGKKMFSLNANARQDFLIGNN